MDIIEVNVRTGEKTTRAMTAEEIAALPTPDPNDAINAQIAALEAQFSTTMQMRVSLGDQAAISETAALLANIDALKAQLVP